MALRSFDTFFHGSPVVLPQAETRLFGGWFHGSPHLAIVLGSTTQLVTLQMRARIVVPTVRSLQMRAHILFTPYDLQMRARITRRQGWPIPDPFDPAAENFTPTQLRMRGRITAVGTRSTQSMSMRAKLFRGSAGQTMSMRAFIVSGQTMSMRARILPRFFSVETAMGYYVSNDFETSVTMVFYTKGGAPTQTLSMGARIVKVYTAEVTHHAIVAPGQTQFPVITFDFFGADTTLQTLSMRAKVVRP